MSRERFFIAVSGIIIITAVILNIYQNRTRFVDLKIGQNYYHLEIADTSEKQRKGLSGRDFLAENQGMLFKFIYPSRYIFTTKEMKFPIDIIWLLDNKIVDLTPDAGLEQNENTEYFPRLPVNRVIEVNAGVISKESLKIGDMIFFP
jgi:uncharacterized membrane protein (UPF0127 family)